MATNKIQSQSDRSIHPVRNFFIPPFAAWILFSLLGTSLIVVYNSSQIIHWLGDNYVQSTTSFSLNIHILNNGFTSAFDSALSGRLGQIIFWSLVGAGVYIALWFVRNILNSFENDVIIEHYTHPTNFDRSGYWGSAIAGKVFFAVIFVLTVIYTYLGIKVVLPTAGALTGNAIFYFRALPSIAYIFLSVIIATAVIYIWVLLVRFLTHLWKLL